MTYNNTSKEIKELIENIKQEQNEKGSNDTERLKDWEERFIEQREIYIDLLTKEKEKIRRLEEKDDNKQISLLKEQYEKEIRELKDKKEIVDSNYDCLSEEYLGNQDDLERLKKEVEELGKILKEKKRENQTSLLNKYYKDEVEVLKIKIKNCDEEIKEYNKKDLNDSLIVSKKRLRKLELEKELEEKEAKLKESEKLLNQQNACCQIN